MLSGPARHRHFRSNHITGLKGSRVLCHPRQSRCPFCGYFNIQWTWGIIRQSHTAVQVDLLETRFDISPDQIFRLCHRNHFGFILPDRWSQVISPQDNIFVRELDVIGDGVNVIYKIRGLHTGVTAKLVDLVAGCLDECGNVQLVAGDQCLLDHIGVS